MLQNSKCTFFSLFKLRCSWHRTFFISFIYSWNTEILRCLDISPYVQNPDLRCYVTLSTTFSAVSMAATTSLLIQFRIRRGATLLWSQQRWLSRLESSNLWPLSGDTVEGSCGKFRSRTRMMEMGDEGRPLRLTAQILVLCFVSLPGCCARQIWAVPYIPTQNYES